VELDDGYYYTDTTWMDSDGGGIRYNWYCFNEELLDQFTKLGMTIMGSHERDYLSILLPTANGTKYAREYNPDEDYTWAGDGEDPRLAMSKPSEPVTVEINGRDVSSKLNVMEKDGELFAESKGFIEAFADRGKSESSRWFRPVFLPDVWAPEVVSATTGDTLFILNAHFIERPTADTIYLGSSLRPYNLYNNDDVYVPMLAFCKALGEMGYDVEIIINGKAHTFKPNSDNTEGKPSVSSSGTQTRPPSLPEMPDKPAAEPSKEPVTVTSAAPPTSVVADGIDITSDLTIEALDGVFYAEGESFIESLRYADDPNPEAHSFYYDFITDYDAVYNLLEEYYMDEYFIRDGFEQFLGMDAIVVCSWYTDEAVFALFVGSEDAVSFPPMEDHRLVRLGEPPRLVDGNVYIPIKAFADLAGIPISIE
jgi:hypothetical protein